MTVSNDALALITGAASGIGRAVASRCAGLGFCPVVVDLDVAAGEGVAAMTNGLFVRADVADPAAWSDVAAAIDTDGRALRFVHLNAGMMTRISQLDDVPLERYRQVCGVNIDGVVFGLQTTLPRLRRAGGAVIATASLAAVRPFPRDPVYAMAKVAVTGLVRSLAPQIAADGITINAICPGAVDTGLLQDTTRARLAAAGEPLLDPADVAEAVVNLAISGATGEVVVVEYGIEPTAVPPPALGERIVE